MEGLGQLTTEGRVFGGSMRIGCGLLSGSSIVYLRIERSQNDKPYNQFFCDGSSVGRKANL